MTAIRVGLARVAGVISAAVLLAGCLEGTSAPATSLSAAADTLQATLDSSSKDATKLRRTNFAYRLALTGAGLTRTSFVDFACQGAGAYAEQRAAIGGVRQLGTTVDTLAAAPSGDLSKVIASIQKYRTKIEPLPDVPGDVEDKAFANCQAQTAEDMALLLDGKGSAVGGKSIMAIAGAFAALQALAEATQKLILLGAQRVDAAQRAARFREFMNDPKTLASLRHVLGPCVVPVATSTDTDPDFDVATWPADKFGERTKACFAKAQSANARVALSDKRMGEIIAERRRLSLLVPYNDFLALKYSGGVSQSPYLASVGKVDAALATFDSLRELKVSKTQQLDMVTAVNELWRISQGKLTAGEDMQQLWAAAQTLGALFQNASEDIGGVEDKWKAFIDAVKKI